MAIQTTPECYSWIWLAGATEPVVAGRVFRDGSTLAFEYLASYLERHDAISIYGPELPLQPGPIAPPAGMALASCIRDAAPDAWGRRVLASQDLSSGASDLDGAGLDEIACLLRSGSDRIGALDFQSSATSYTPRSPRNATLARLQDGSQLLQRGVPLTGDLEAALVPSCAVGGARPKALLSDGKRSLIAKFTGTSDSFDIVRTEFLAMRLAHLAGLIVAQVELAPVVGQTALLIERFDRIPGDSGWGRRPMVSGLTLLGLDEMMARYASYEDFAAIIRDRFRNPLDTLRELFRRVVFNILCGNTDDHARNHAAFWDGASLKLTPAYDICPQSRHGNEASQAMLIQGEHRESTLARCIAAASTFGLSEPEATAIVIDLVDALKANWDRVCDEAGIDKSSRRQLMRRQFLNPYAFEGLAEDFASD